MIEPEHELHARRRGRNLGVLMVLGALVVLLFAVTIVKMRGEAANPSTNVSWGETLREWILK